MSRVIISGSTSFIGLKLIDALLVKDTEIIALVRPHSPKRSLLPHSGRINPIQLDMEDYKDLEKYISSGDCFIHLAWNGTRGEDRMDTEKQRNNYRAAMAALRASIALGCQTFITAGSQAEYGPYNCPIDENTPCRPNTEYGREKLHFYKDALGICREAKISFKEPRFFSLYGPGDFSGTMVISSLKKMLRNEECAFTECKQMWDFLYITDAVNGIIRLMRPGCPDGAYNFGSGDAKNLKYFIEEMRRLTRSRSRMLYGAVPYPSTGMVSIQPVINKLLRTGWRPEVSFENGILSILESLRSGEEK